ncbi:conserved hypothetical protein [Talaromyces stipitatus ATCC 10500]|uniref:Integral membrane protein n=1 Tax=Talaromyces stipitatus (strain ATCC 10500 / CBS 375.48 / QM 6759 / NRRL 1006) TaxID=441959 RepID=B8LZM4_TALSN|nr:uncharacterized protein TSTA_096960 [Talaromyces stipitatus ATCC 10500]EED22447.1 conserved hypothetical protein [Talaromyces stipitatus ATCC 10500]
MKWPGLVLAAAILQAMCSSAAAVNASTSDVSQADDLADYSREDVASNILYAHISFMVLGWVGVLPIYVMLNIARSSLRYPVHITYLGLHGIGMILGLAYKSRTLDLYPGSSHGKLGWALTVLILTHFIVGVLRSFTRHDRFDRRRDIGHELAPLTTPEHIEATNSSSRDTSRGLWTSDCSTEETAFIEPTSCSRRWPSVSQPRFSIRLLGISHDIAARFFLVFGFSAICTGIVTMTAIFVRDHIFNGLAHFIKGGVFFWFGILTLGRWAGCFSAQGWAWNLQPLGLKRNSITMETIECFLILIYGITNVFLEHLSAWGQAWSPMDIEHVAVSLLFIGGGLCGLMVNSKPFHAIDVPDYRDVRLHDDSLLGSENIGFRVPINPIPAMTIFLLGFILAGHHQSNTESTVMHNQVGAHSLGQLYIWLTRLGRSFPCRSLRDSLHHLPLAVHISSRVTVSIKATFRTNLCLLSDVWGDLAHGEYAQNKDTVQAMTDHHFPAVSVAILTMSMTAMIMAWSLFALTVRRWAAAREKRWERKSSQA